MRRLLIVFGVLAAVAAFVLPSRADIPSILNGPTNFSVSGQLPTITLTGQSSCSYTLGGTGSGTLTPKGSSDGGKTFFTITTSDFGPQTVNGTYGGSLIRPSTPPVMTNFFVQVTVTSGTISAAESCSSAVATMPTPSPTNTTGNFAQVNCSTPIVCSPNIGPTPSVGCAGIPFACAVTIQGTAFGVVADNGLTDNGPFIQAAVNAGCTNKGGTITLPYGRIGVGTPVTWNCSGITFQAQGRGYGGGSGHFPTAIPPATTLFCMNNLGGQPILYQGPLGSTASVEQTANVISDMGFDGNSDTCANGFYSTGEQQPQYQRLSFTHFSGIGFHVQGKQLSGGGQGSVIHPFVQTIQISEDLPGDGVGMVWDGDLSFGGTFGDVFSGNGGNIACVTYQPTCVVIGRSDHLEIDDIQVNQTNAGPTPTPAPSGQPSPTPFPGIVITCGAEGDKLGGNILAQVAVMSSPSPCPSPLNGPHGTTIAVLQTYSNSASGISITGANIRMDDDHGDIYLSAQPDATQPLYLCFGIQAFGASSCAPGDPVMWGDTLGNLSIGTRSGNTESRIQFCGSGCGPGTTPNRYDSFIATDADPGGAGALEFDSGTYYSNRDANLTHNLLLGNDIVGTGGDTMHISPNAAAGTALVISPSGTAAGRILDVQDTLGVSQFFVGFGGGVTAGNNVTATSSLISLAGNLNLNSSGTNNINTQAIAGTGLLIKNVGNGTVGTGALFMDVQDITGVSQFSVGNAGTGIFRGGIKAGAGTLSTPFSDNTATCTMVAATSCLLIQTVPVGTTCTASLTSDPVIDAVHTLTLWSHPAPGSGTFTTHIEVIQGTTVTNTPTWNTVCL